MTQEYTVQVERQTVFENSTAKRVSFQLTEKLQEVIQTK
jgi:hypothetical protein